MIAYSGKAQSGFTLVELMIASTLSVFMIAATITLFVNSKETSRINENLARLQENGRFAVSLISRDIRMADYRSCVTDERRNDAVAGQNNTGLNGSDTVTVLWQNNDCGAANSIVSTVYSIQTGATGSPSLFKSVNGGTAIEMVEGIEDLQVLFGEDTDSDFVPNYYVSAADITDMAQTTSIRFTVIARTLEAGISVVGEGRITRDFTSTITLRNRVP